jgi:hypothetical protein
MRDGKEGLPVNGEGPEKGAARPAAAPATLRRAVRRVPPALYLSARQWLLERDPDGRALLDWAQRLAGPPPDPEKMAAEIVWIVLCAGRTAQAARTIEARVWRALREGRPAVEAFGHRKRAAAIDAAWRGREALFESLGRVLAAGDPGALVQWCDDLPQVGDDTKWQLAKNWGADVCKPDIWLSRLAGFPDRPRRHWRMRWDACMALCRALSAATGDRVAAVDTMLWLACNKGVIEVSPDAGPVRFVPREITAGRLQS